MSILFKEYIDEEANALFYEDGREIGYDDGYAAGAAEQRAKYEAELKAQAERIRQLEAMLAKK